MNRASAPGYDLFKLAVTFILAAIILILLLRGCSPTTPPGQQMPLASPTATAQPTKTVVPPPAVKPEVTLTPTPSAQPTPNPSPKYTSANAECPGAAVSRLKDGDKVRVLANLNMRIDPGLHGRWIVTNTTGTELEIIGGPACTNIDRRAYEWWHVRRADGKEGWSAEASLNSTFYFLEPIP